MDVQKTLAEAVVDYGAVRKFIAANPILSVIATALVVMALTALVCHA